MKVFDAVKAGMNEIANSESPRLDAEVILAYCLKMDRMHLYMNRSMNVDDEKFKKYMELIKRRKYNEPVSYITGNREFMSLNFFVKKGVLIPRPDTECLVEEVINRMKDVKDPVIADVGCGSGAISVSLAKNLPSSSVYALDISDTALEVTGINAERNGVGERVHAVKSDIFSSFDISFEGKFNAIVSNPPYIKKDEIPKLMNDVKDYEPYEALCGGDDGLKFYRKITSGAVKYLKKNGILAYEIGYDEGEDVKSILIQNGFSDVVCKKDLAGLDRVVVGTK